MEQVHREEVQDFVTYEEQRSEVRESTMKIKEIRRIDVGDVLSFIFENKERLSRNRSRRICCD